MNRGIKDEGFIRRALEEATNEMGRWIANQDFFNGFAVTEINPLAKCALVTAVAIYGQKYPDHFSEDNIKEALAVATIGDARNLIDDLSQKIPQYK
jgi:hypothetical protein